MKMIRKIIKIDEEKCNGCGLCAEACHEAAIAVTGGRAKLLRDDYCDGLGNCLPVCPTEAISFEEREAAGYDGEAVRTNMTRNARRSAPAGVCPGSDSRTIRREARLPSADAVSVVSRLRQWPVQIKLAPLKAPYFEGANLLISADCAAYARGNFHEEFMRNRITLIGCPKLDDGDYSEKLTEIISRNNIKSVTVVRMEVPCCGGIENAAIAALENSGKTLQWRVVTLSVDGGISED
jgi:ferredoxin